MGIIIGALGFLQLGGISLNKMNSLVPFTVGLIFFMAGSNLVKAAVVRA
ncbi:hypothetical protein [Hymenobacter aquaticus]|nr:hypothetical protein [Hymenobacter aquaticus]